MLVILDDVLVDVLPYPFAASHFELAYHPKAKSFGVYADGVLIESGIRWYSFTRGVDIDVRTGVVSTKKAQIAKIRAIFCGKHLEGEFQL